MPHRSLTHIAAQTSLLLMATGSWAGCYWHGVARDLPVTPNGNTVAISCHNCYGNSYAATQSQVSIALQRDFDLVELDLTRHADGKIYIEHDQSESPRGLLVDTLSSPELEQSDRMLFLELKENYTTDAASDAMLLSILRIVRDMNYARAGRPATLRAFVDGATNRQQHLVRAKALLQLPEFASIRDHVRLHTLLKTDVDKGIATTKALGFQGVELQFEVRNLFEAIKEAKRQKLGVGVFTTPAATGEVYLAALREHVDFITTDYDRAPQPHTYTARALIKNSSFENLEPIVPVALAAWLPVMSWSWLPESAAGSGQVRQRQDCNLPPARS